MAETTPVHTEFMQDALIANVTQLGTSGRQAAANMIRGGQLGSGLRLPHIDAASPLVFNPAIIVVTHVPAMWNEYPKLQEMLKSLVETHAKTITGIDFGYELETNDTIVGHDGQTMKVPTRSTRTAVNPSMTFQEVSGNLVWNLMRMWISDIQHPDTNFSKLSAQMDGGSIPPWLMSSYSMSMVAILFDPTGLPERIIDAAFYTNMFPTTTGELGMERTLGATNTKERTINFTGIVQHNENTRELGYHIAKMLNLHKINYDFALPGLSGKVMPAEGAISKTISRLGLYDEALGTEMPAVTSFVPMGDNPYADRVDGNVAFQPDADSNPPE